jgi:hypothetical protein
MDTTEAIILTTIVNVIITGLVGGIVIYTIQKKIDATIQKSLFEYQTKFTRNFSKTLEVLDKLHQKVLDYSSSYSVLTYHIEAQILGRKVILTDQEFEKKARETMRAFFDCATFFRENRIYLPDILLGELENIIDKLHALDFYLTGCKTSLQKRADYFPPFLSDVVTDRYELSFLRFTQEMGLQNIDPGDKNAPVVFLKAIRVEVKKIQEQFEKLYKSVAEAQ